MLDDGWRILVGLVCVPIKVHCGFEVDRGRREKVARESNVVKVEIDGNAFEWDFANSAGKGPRRTEIRVGSSEIEVEKTPGVVSIYRLVE